MDALAVISREQLDKTSPTPLYRQLKHRILQLIATGALGCETPLPTELALCDAFGLSRATVRRCFRDLVNDGYVIRKRGRGTFVADPGASGIDALYTQVSTSSNIERSGASASSKVLRVRAIDAEEGVARRLALPRGTSVWEINRLRLADDRPLIHELAYCPRALCPGLDATGFERSLYEYIAEASGTLSARTTEVIEAVVLDRHEARLLGVPVGTAGIRIIATSFDARGRPFETSIGVARADRFCLQVSYSSTGIQLQKTAR